MRRLLLLLSLFPAIALGREPAHAPLCLTSQNFDSQRESQRELERRKLLAPSSHGADPELTAVRGGAAWTPRPIRIWLDAGWRVGPLLGRGTVGIGVGGRM